jgi:hypothetical protein
MAATHILGPLRLDAETDTLFRRNYELVEGVGVQRRRKRWPMVGVAVAAGSAWRVLRHPDDALAGLLIMNGWMDTFEPAPGLREPLSRVAAKGYENQISAVVSKLLLRVVIYVSLGAVKGLPGAQPAQG